MIDVEEVYPALFSILRDAALVTLILSAAGCAVGERANANCEWPHAAAAAVLDLHTSAGRRHLTDDALVAEDLAIRHADAARGHRSGHYAGQDAYSRSREQCMAALFSTIATAHKVAPAQVRDALAHRRASADLAVLASFTALYLFAATLVARWMFHVVPADARWIATVASVLAAVAVSSVGLGFAELWAGLIEMLRVGNGHLSYRASRIPWTHYHLELFMAGMALFGLIAAMTARAARRYTPP